MNKKLALLALIPLVSFLVVPIAVADGGHYVGVTVFVRCNSDSGSGVTSGATLTYNGYTLVVLCTQGNGHSNEICIDVSYQLRFTATAFAGGHTSSDKGTFGIDNPGSAVYGEVYSHHFNAYAEWLLGSPCV